MAFPPAPACRPNARTSPRSAARLRRRRLSHGWQRMGPSQPTDLRSCRPTDLRSWRQTDLRLCRPTDPRQSLRRCSNAWLGRAAARGYAPVMDLDLSAGIGDLTALLVDAKSVSGDEAPLADAIESALGSLSHLALHRDGNAIVARTEIGRPQPGVLAVHIDTVPIADNLPSAIKDGVLYGCGNADMKAGVAVQLKLAASVAEPVMDVTY